MKLKIQNQGKQTSKVCSFLLQSNVLFIEKNGRISGPYLSTLFEQKIHTVSSTFLDCKGICPLLGAL
jgi:hypothetical protein